ITGDLPASNPDARDSGSRVARDAWGAAAEGVCIIRLPFILQDCGGPAHIPRTGHQGCHVGELPQGLAQALDAQVSVWKLAQTHETGADRSGSRPALIRFEWRTYPGLIPTSCPAPTDQP